MLNKTYNPAESEPSLYKKWEEEGAFSCNQQGRENAESFSIVIPPPNVTGSLHMGHALNNTLQDILTRFERMRGKNVLWQPGMDHAGIATQMVVERKLAENNEPSRRDMGREKFLERVWAWKEESGGTIINQLKRLGASCDWGRERFTMDEGLSKAVLEVFVSLYQEGLIYKDKRLVNWDPVLLTAISDLEVEQKDTAGHLWHFAYPLVDGAIDGIEEIVIATTRPETMLGDGAVAVHPSDERYKNLIGKMVRLPIVEREIPIIADEYPDPEFGSGAVKITGAHDFNDFMVANRNDIPLIPILDDTACIITSDESQVPDRFVGLDRFVARNKVLEELEALGLMRGIEDKVISQPFGDRSGVVIEPMLTDQWYVDAETLAKPAIKAVEEGDTVFVPKNWEKTYFEWMRNIQPWCISRQLWWGHRIPAWYGPDGEIFVAKSALEAEKLAEAHYGQPTELTQDEDVLDTWFSSALWPFSTLGWPDDTKELKQFYKTDVLVTGFDIIFFWVARMMMMGLHFKEEVPFHTVYIHALVRDEHGAKMSKSKGNIIDPLELIDEFGADALRFTLTAMAAQGRDIKLSKSRIEGYRNFSTKLWNAARFCEMNECILAADYDPKSVASPINQWILSELQSVAATVTTAIEEHKYNEAASGLYRFIWNIFCDWYLELSKPVLSSQDEEARRETRETAAYVLDQTLILLHPFMPFITEELWGVIAEGYGLERETMLINAQWPDLQGLEHQDAVSEMNWIIDLITEIRSVRAEMNVPAGARTPFVLVTDNQKYIDICEKWAHLIEKLARLEGIATAQKAPKGAVLAVVDGCEFALLLGDIMDLDAEKARLAKEMEKFDQEIALFDKKLNNENFTSRAPEHVVEEQRAKKADAQAGKEKIKLALERLSELE